MTGASQVKLIRDSTGSWYLLGFPGDPDGDPNGPDYADVYGVRFRPFAITPRLLSVHIFFRPGDTSFTSTWHVPKAAPRGPSAAVGAVSLVL